MWRKLLPVNKGQKGRSKILANNSHNKDEGEYFV